MSVDLTGDQALGSLLVMGHPVNFIDLYLTERSSFDSEDLLEEVGLRVQEVVVVLTP